MKLSIYTQFYNIKTKCYYVFSNIELTEIIII